MHACLYAAGGTAIMVSASTDGSAQVRVWYQYTYMNL